MSDLRSILQEIYAEHGRLTPELVVQAATPESSPLHHRFVWDNDEAAQRYREVQARELIRSVRVAYRRPDGHEGDVRYFHAVRRPTGNSYTPVDEIVQDEVTTKILLNQMEREFLQLKRRYENFDEFWQLVRAQMPAAG